MTFPPGTRIEHYTVERLLGRGGMALVYLVRHDRGTLHALKVLTLGSPLIRGRMLREGRLQGALRHPNIVPVTDLIDIAGAPGLVMEFVDGPSLEALLARFRPTPAQADTLAIGILEGVAFAHRRGLVHRDLKPANVLLASTPQGLLPRVTDFGLAKIVNAEDPQDLHATRSGMVMGTPAFMSPEQIRDSKHVDQRADVFSLGVLLYYLVAGQKPFVGQDIVQLYTAITRGTYRPVQQWVPDLPDRMERAIACALVTDREARVEDAGALLAIWRGDAPGRRPRVSAARDTVVPDLPDPFFPEAPADAQQLTFDQPVGASGTHPLLDDLTGIRFAMPDIGAIDPNGVALDEPRVVFPVDPHGNSLADDEISAVVHRPWGLYAVIGALALGLVLGGGWLASQEPAASPEEPSSPSLPAPEPSITVPVSPMAPHPPSPKPVKTRSKTVASPPIQDGAEIPIEDVQIAPDAPSAGAVPDPSAPMVDTHPGNR